jgi:hypothetical protein
MISVLRAIAYALKGLLTTIPFIKRRNKKTYGKTSR